MPCKLLALCVALEYPKNGMFQSARKQDISLRQSAAVDFLGHAIRNRREKSARKRHIQSARNRDIFFARQSTRKRHTLYKVHEIGIYTFLIRLQTETNFLFKCCDTF